MARNNDKIKRANTYDVESVREREGERGTRAGVRTSGTECVCERDRPGFEIVQCHCSQTRAIREAPAPVADEWTVVVYDSVHVLLILRPQFHVSFAA